jgi:hypothetical protein
MLTSHSNNLWTLPKHLLSIIQKHAQTSPTPEMFFTLTCNWWPFWSLSTFSSPAAAMTIETWSEIMRMFVFLIWEPLHTAGWHTAKSTCIYTSTYGQWKFAEAPTPFPHLPALAWSRVLKIIPLPQKHGNHNVIRAWWEPADLLGVVIEQQLVKLCMKNLTVISLLLYIGIEQTFPGIDDKLVSDMVFCKALQLTPCVLETFSIRLCLWWSRNELLS